jgi:hypothetical protein
MTCNWPDSVCKCWEQEQTKPDVYGRVYMHCEEGLSFTKASMTRLVMFCLGNNVEITSLHPFNRHYKGCQVSVVVRIDPMLIESFEKETLGKLREPSKINLN